MEIQDRQNHVLHQLIQQQQQGMMALTLSQPSLYSTDRRYPSNANAKHAHVFCVNIFTAIDLLCTCRLLFWKTKVSRF